MARNNQRGTTTRRAPKDLGRRVKKKPCALCRDRTEWVDYKDVPMLRKYMSDRGKIRSRRVTGNCAQHQRALGKHLHVHQPPPGRPEAIVQALAELLHLTPLLRICGEQALLGWNPLIDPFDDLR